LNSTIDKNYGWGVGTDVGFALLLESDASSTYKRLAMKKIIKKKNNNKKIVTHLEWYIRQSCLALTHLS